MRRASASERSPRSVPASAASVSVLLTAAALFAAPSMAAADAGGPGDGGDGSLQLIPEVITNSGISAGGSSDFPVKARLFLPEATQQAQRLAADRARIPEAIAKVDFADAGAPVKDDLAASARQRLFDGYAPRAIAGTEAEEKTSSQTDVWLVAMLFAAIPLTVLATWTGARLASRRARRHA